MTAVTVSHDCIDYQLSLEVLLTEEDYALIEVVSGQSVIGRNELEDLCQPLEGMTRCRFEVGRANETFGILY